MLSGVYAAADVLSPDLAYSIQTTFGLTLNAGVVLALSLLPSRRQFPLFLLIVACFSVVVRLPSYPLVYAIVITLANLSAMVLFRTLALRYAGGFGRLDGRRGLLSLLGCGLAAAAVSAIGATALFVLAVHLRWISDTHGPGLEFLLGTRLAAQRDGVVAITPLMLTLMRRRPGSWPWTAWAETGSWLTLMIAMSVTAVQVPGAAPMIPLLLLVTFAGMLFAVLRRGTLAAAVLSPAFALSAAVMMLSYGAQVASGTWPRSLEVLPSQIAGFVAALLAWAVAVVVAERDAARARALTEQAAQEALTTLQRALLPTEVASTGDVTVASRYRAAGSKGRVGGDWYDTIPLPSGGIALVIGDVEGHDLHAASVMGLVRGAVRSHALEGLPPALIMARVNGFLASAGTDRLVTMAYVQLFPDDTVATVALAGHPPPLAVPPGGPAWALDVRSGPILGLGGVAAAWEEQTVPLSAQATLVLYTDGLIDFPTASDDQVDQFVALAARAGQGPLDRLADVLISSAPPYDDTAVLVARVTSSGRAPSTQRAFPAQPISAGVARLWMGDLFGIWQADGRLPSTCDLDDALGVAQLLLTELVSNAVRHSDQSVTVRLHLGDRLLRVDVEDSSDRMPVMRQPEDAVAEGRGLRLVDALAGRWGVDLVERGKSVWFELGLGDAAHGANGPDGSDDSDGDRLLCVLALGDPRS